MSRSVMLDWHRPAVPSELRQRIAGCFFFYALFMLPGQHIQRCPGRMRLTPADLHAAKVMRCPVSDVRRLRLSPAGRLSGDLPGWLGRPGVGLKRCLGGVPFAQP
jgi:hypothetical protein